MMSISMTICRSLSHMFAAVNARKAAGENITVHCSFLEIYQEVGYDLLKTASKTGPGPTTFAKVYNAVLLHFIATMFFPVLSY